MGAVIPLGKADEKGPFFAADNCLLAAPSRASSSPEPSLRDADDHWSKAAATHDLEKTLSFYSPDAVVMPPNEPSFSNRDAIRDVWKKLLADAVKISWTTTRAEISQSGDLGYTSGTYEITTRNDRGETIQDRGKYVEVWRKQTDGSWKCSVDMFNSDLPPSLQ